MGAYYTTLHQLVRRNVYKLEAEYSDKALQMLIYWTKKARNVLSREYWSISNTSNIIISTFNFIRFVSFLRLKSEQCFNLDFVTNLACNLKFGVLSIDPSILSHSSGH